MSNNDYLKQKNKDQEVAKALFEVTYLSKRKSYQRYYGHGNNPPDIRKGDSLDEVRRELEQILPEDVEIKSIQPIEANGEEL